MEKIYVFGHRVPDTASVTAAITLANLKNKQGLNASPRVLGDINSETNFVLNYFGFPQPEYLNDVKLQIKDINYQKNYFIHTNESILTAYNYMNNNYISTLPIVDEQKVFKDMISMKDITKDHIEGDFYHLRSSYENIIQVLDGKEILKFDNEVSGNILVASYGSTTFINNITIDNDSILIIDDRHGIHEYATKKQS